MNKYTIQKIKDFSYKNDIVYWDNGSLSCTIQIGYDNFGIKQFYPIDDQFYTDDENYRIEFIAKKNNLTKEEYIKILADEKIRSSLYLKREKKPKKKIKLDIKCDNNESYLEKLRNVAKND